jgi:hypothetical protein
MFTRKDPTMLHLKFLESGSGQQETAKFRIPIMLNSTLASSSVIMTSGPSSTTPDTYTSYVFKTTSPELNVLWVKVFHLSVAGCLTLHTRSILAPTRAAPTSEYHILGLLAVRQTTYDIMHQEPFHLAIRFMTDLDLKQIGWKRNPATFSNLWKAKSEIQLAKQPLMEQMQFTPPSYFSNPTTIAMVQRRPIPISDPSLVPLHYPQIRTRFPPENNDQPALFFPDTAHPLAVTRNHCEISVDDFLAQLSPPPGVSKIDAFLRLFNVPRTVVENKAITHNLLSTVLEKFALWNQQTNGLCNFRHVRSNKEPFIVTIPKQWEYIVTHAALNNENKKHQFPAIEDHDWA